MIDSPEREMLRLTLFTAVSNLFSANTAEH